LGVMGSCVPFGDSEIASVQTTVWSRQYGPLKLPSLYAPEDVNVRFCRGNHVSSYSMPFTLAPPLALPTMVTEFGPRNGNWKFFHF
jgi:hypothetical protein